MKRPCRQTGNSVERGANYAPATLCDRVGGIAVPGSGMACFSGGCTPPHRDCERPNTAKAMSEIRQKKSEKYTLSVVFRGSRGNRRGHRLRSMPPPRTKMSRGRNNTERERAETKTVRSRNDTERERAEQKQPAAVTTPSGNEPKQKQPAAVTTPSGNEPKQKQPAAGTTPSGNEPKQKQPAAGTTPSGNEPKQKRPAAGTAPSGNGTNRNSPRATEGGGPSFGRHAQGIYRSATRCRGVLSGTTGESSSSSSSSMSVTSRPVSTPSV